MSKPYVKLYSAENLENKFNNSNKTCHAPPLNNFEKNIKNLAYMLQHRKTAIWLLPKCCASLIYFPNLSTLHCANYIWVGSLPLCDMALTWFKRFIDLI